MIPCECKPNFEKPVNYSIPAFLISPSWHALNSKLPLCLLWWVTDDGSPSSNPSLKYLTKLINMFTHYAVKDNEGHGSDHVTWEPPQSRWSYRSRSASKPHPLFHRVSLVCVTQVLVSNISAMCCCKGHTLWSKYGGGPQNFKSDFYVWPWNLPSCGAEGEVGQESFIHEFGTPLSVIPFLLPIKRNR